MKRPAFFVSRLYGAIAGHDGLEGTTKDRTGGDHGGQPEAEGNNDRQGERIPYAYGIRTHPFPFNRATALLPIPAKLDSKTKLSTIS